MLNGCKGAWIYGVSCSSCQDTRSLELGGQGREVEIHTDMTLNKRCDLSIGIMSQINLHQASERSWRLKGGKNFQVDLIQVFVFLIPPNLTYMELL